MDVELEIRKFIKRKSPLEEFKRLYEDYRFRDQSDGAEITVCQDWNEEKAKCPLK